MQNFQDELQAIELDNFQVGKLNHVDPKYRVHCGGDSKECENDIHIHIDIDIDIGGGGGGGGRCGDRCFNCFNCGGQQPPIPPKSPKPSQPLEDDE